MMLERYREREEEEGIEKIGQKKRGRYFRPLKKLNHPNHIGSKGSFLLKAT